MLVALIFAKEAWIQDVLKLSQNSSSAPLGSDGWQSSAINGCPSLEERAIAAATSRELLPACGPWCSQVPCELSASSVRQVFQSGTGAGRWSGGRWWCEERQWTVEGTENRSSATASSTSEHEQSMQIDTETFVQGASPSSDANRQLPALDDLHCTLGLPEAVIVLG